MPVPAAVFSGKLRVAVSVAKSGATFATAVAPVPEADQPPAPTALVARTCTW